MKISLPCRRVPVAVSANHLQTVFKDPVLNKGPVLLGRQDMRYGGELKKNWLLFSIHEKHEGKSDSNTYLNSKPGHKKCS